MKQNNTAILLFSRTAKVEAAEKPLSRRKQAVHTIASFMVNRAKQIAKKTTLPIVFFSEKQQYGNTFGERFANAFEYVFALGYEKVIAIGNDCLSLSSAEILHAANILDNSATTTVLGATDKGGTYLIGLNKAIFQKEAFQNLQWQTENIFSELIQFVDNQSVEIELLSQKTDLNNISDWGKTLETVSLFVKKILLSLLNPSFRASFLSYLLPINSRYLATTTALRAPPYLYR